MEMFVGLEPFLLKDGVYDIIYKYTTIDFGIRLYPAMNIIEISDLHDVLLLDNGISEYYTVNARSVATAGEDLVLDISILAYLHGKCHMPMPLVNNGYYKGNVFCYMDYGYIESYLSTISIFPPLIYTWNVKTIYKKLRSNDNKIFEVSHTDQFNNCLYLLHCELVNTNPKYYSNSQYGIRCKERNIRDILS